jgi:hypothetical protein
VTANAWLFSIGGGGVAVKVERRPMQPGGAPAVTSPRQYPPFVTLRCSARRYSPSGDYLIWTAGTSCGLSRCRPLPTFKKVESQ